MQDGLSPASLVPIIILPSDGLAAASRRVGCGGKTGLSGVPHVARTENMKHSQLLPENRLDGATGIKQHVEG